MALAGVVPAGCVFNDDGPRTGPGLEPPSPVGTPGTSGDNSGGPLATAGMGGLMNPGMVEPPPVPATPGAGTGAAAAGTSGGAQPPGAPSGAAGSGSGASAGTGASNPGAAGAGGDPMTNPDGGAAGCETERWPALGLDQRIIAPPGDAAMPLGACEYALPESAAAYLPDRVNLELTRDGQRESVPRVAGASACDLLRGGFYYDDAQDPMRIVACPSTCIAIAQGDADIVLGCPTVTR